MKQIKSYGEFYYMTKAQIANYLIRAGFACLASLKQTKDSLIYNAIDIYKKYGDKNDK